MSRKVKATVELEKGDSAKENHIPKASKSASDENMITTQKANNSTPKTESKGTASQSMNHPNTAILESLTDASSTLAESLLLYPGGDQWVHYLQPNMLPTMALQDKYQELNELLSRNGLTFARTEIRMVSRIVGFTENRNQLCRSLKSAK